MMQYQSTLDLWLARAVEDPDLAAELEAVRSDPDAVTDRFYRDLAFGTGGLRGVIGAGTNRMNLYTVRRATQGLADYLNASGLPKKVAIAHDSLRKGELFCREAARVLAANGITAYLYPRLEPTPALSWATRYLGCGAGICVTASHNPAKYNGYKVYGADGCQITLEAAAKVLAAIGQHDYFDSPKLVDYDEAVAAGTICSIDDKCLSDFVDAVLALRPGNDVSKLKLVYTPLNGSGLEPVRMLLARMGVTQVTVVPEQEQPEHMGLESSQCVHWMVDYICDHREPVKLLLCKAEGTSYEHFVHNMVEVEVEYTLQYLEVLHRLGHESPQLDAQLCHIIASGMFNGIFEIVVHDMPKEQAMHYVDQLRDFYTAGWLKLIGQ